MKNMSIKSPVKNYHASDLSCQGSVQSIDLHALDSNTCSDKNLNINFIHFIPGCVKQVLLKEKDIEDQGLFHHPLKIHGFSYFIIFLFAAAIFIVSCAGKNMTGKYRPIMGYWRTDRNIILSVHNSPGHGVAAVIKRSPGFLSEEVKQDKAIITHIQPLADGGFTGLFEMPGKKKPVRVKMIFSSPDTLVIMTWDRRVKGNIMKWLRVKKVENLKLLY